MRASNQRWLLILALIIAPVATAGALGWAEVLPNTDWELTLDATDLTGGAGTDFPTDIESDAAAQQISIRGIFGGPNGNWAVSVERTDDANWHPALEVYVRRTSDGTGTGTVGGGTSYQEITAVSTEFFTGTGTRAGMGLQFRTNGGFVDLALPAGTYTTTVTYTFADNL